jgi:anti-sigma factor RsiW
MTTADPDIRDRPHDEAEELLPWYATGQLEETERERVEAHLAACSDCRDQLVLERQRIQAFRAYSPQLESGWRRLRAQIDVPAASAAHARTSFRQTAAELWTAFTRPAVVAFATVQVVFLTFASGLLIWLSQPAYQALGSKPAPASANAIVMFGASATEQDIRSALRAAGASLVGGPTETGAYLIHVDPSKRNAALASLQSSRSVQLAQPIDTGAGK